ncbi:hypothetical protein CC2G_011314 [Coprinopsis cinerea AmutBmut pab1-1]|nr:hypothetical protein CC2G_011314 [Coprinopsis cinerea AmutBmut pab1-1]
MTGRIVKGGWSKRWLKDKMGLRLDWVPKRGAVDRLIRVPPTPTVSFFILSSSPSTFTSSPDRFQSIHFKCSLDQSHRAGDLPLSRFNSQNESKLCTPDCSMSCRMWKELLPPPSRAVCHQEGIDSLHHPMRQL